MTPTNPLHALAASARLANIPSVVVNVWLGVALAVRMQTGAPGQPCWVEAAILAMAGVALYLAGTFLNDWADRHWDALHRPERGLPQALFSPCFYRSVAIACGLLGLSLAAVVHAGCLVVALMIGCCIVLYTRVHKRAAWSVIPMGLCRALLPVLGFVGMVALDAAPWTLREYSIHPGVPLAVAACACGLFCHVVGLSRSARMESLTPPPAAARRQAWGWFAAAALAMFLGAFLGLRLPWFTCLGGLLPYGLWITHCCTGARKPVAHHVANLLAGIPLVDWIVLLPLALAWHASPGSIPGVAALGLLLPPLAVLAGKLLQRLAAAT